MRIISLIKAEIFFHLFFITKKKNWQNNFPSQSKRELHNHLQFINTRHHSQHQTSVDAAKQNMFAQLSKYEQQTGQRQFGASENYVAAAGCSTCGGAGSQSFNSR